MIATPQTDPLPCLSPPRAQLLRRAMAADVQADCASGWKALAEVQYENMQYEAAYDTAVRGLAWLQTRWVPFGGDGRGYSEGLRMVRSCARGVIAWPC